MMPSESYDLFPWPANLGDAGRVVARKLRGEEIDRAVLLRAGWHATGFACGMLVPGPTGAAATTSGPAMSQAEAATLLEDCCSQERQPGARDIGRAIDWGGLLKVILPLLLEWASRR